MAAGSAVWLAGTGRLDPHGMIAIPVLHDPADDRAVLYTPRCSSTAIPICLHPAYAVYLPALAAALGPVLDEVNGLPGAPSRISQTTPTYRESGNGIDVTVSPPRSGAASVYWIVLPNQLGVPVLTVTESAAQVRANAGRGVVADVVGDGSYPAQQAVAAAILGTSDLPPGSPVARAA